MGKVTFLNPEFLWLFLVLPIAIAWLFYKRNQLSATVKMSSLEPFKQNRTFLAKAKPFLYVLRILALSSIIIALARPRSVDVTSKSKTTKGIDIVMAIDVSSSMLANDLKPNRLEALKKVAADFIKGRVDDRLGIVVYAAEAYTKAPVTSDKNMLLNQLADIHFYISPRDKESIKKILKFRSSSLRDSAEYALAWILNAQPSNDSRVKSR